MRVNGSIDTGRGGKRLKRVVESKQGNLGKKGKEVNEAGNLVQ